MAPRGVNAVAVFMTAANRGEARRLADALVREKIAACVQVLGGVRSVYRWKGKIERASEILLIAKTLRARFPALLARVKQLHSYSVPEVVAVPLPLANADYLSWLRESVD